MHVQLLHPRETFLIHKYAAIIESALLAFPIVIHYDGVPVDKVIFKVGTLKSPKFVTAQEL